MNIEGLSEDELRDRFVFQPLALDLSSEAAKKLIFKHWMGWPSRLYLNGAIQVDREDTFFQDEAELGIKVALAWTNPELQAHAAIEDAKFELRMVDLQNKIDQIIKDETGA